MREKKGNKLLIKSKNFTYSYKFQIICKPLFYIQVSSSKAASKREILLKSKSSRRQRLKDQAGASHCPIRLRCFILIQHFKTCRRVDRISSYRMKTHLQLQVESYFNQVHYQKYTTTSFPWWV